MVNDFEDFLKAKAGIPKTLVKRKLRQYSLYFPQNRLMLTESREEFSDLHSIFRLCALRDSARFGVQTWAGLFESRLTLTQG